MELSLFDLHCDTAEAMLTQKQSFTKNDLAVSLKKASVFRRYIQVMAFWTDHRLNDEEGWLRYREMLENLRADSALQEGSANLTTSVPPADHLPALLLSIEDARILAGKPERIDRLFEDGVRMLIPFWSGSSCLGGAHDTNVGLTDFGRKALDHALELGMILDISHASEVSAEEIFALSRAHRRPVIASHSNAYDVCPVSRNLRHAQVRQLLESGGIIGLNLYQKFLTTNKEPAYAEELFSHIDWFLEEGAASALCLGCDMDGCRLPEDIPDVGALPHLAELMLAHHYPEQLVQDIFYNNAYQFFKTNLINQ